MIKFTFILPNQGPYFLGFLKQGYRNHELCITFSKFYRRHYNLVSKFNVGFKISP